LITNVFKQDLESLGYVLDDKITIQINNKPVTLPYVKTFMNVPVGASLLYVDSRGRLGIAVNQGNYSKKFSVEPPATLFIPRKNTATRRK
jgi:S-adenosyl-L-methionine hydrolase (adenosine-forming)